ncbi:MAG: hypothetical protein PHG82_05630 [Candidatus Gracilibacteria bacterium]|nr:hypothetical protein [Candidatus Gracilibacteria bacterium]
MLEQFKNILSDLPLVYKNFIHWNISKVLITVFGFFLGVILSLPFFIVLALFIYFDPIAWKDVISSYFSSGGSIGMSLMAEVYNNYIILIIEGIILFLGFIFFIFGFSYKNLTITNLYLSYLKGEKLEYLKNLYFNFKTIFSYLKLLFLVILILLIPVFIFIISFIILLYSFGGVDSVFNLLNSGETNIFSVLLGSFALICILAFIYLAYRLSFSYIIFLDKDIYSDENKISFYVKESFNITSGLKIFKFLLLIIIFSIFMIPFDYLGSLVENRHQAIVLLYSLILFLTIGGLFEMYIVSIYKRVMLNNNGIEKKD